MLEIDNTQINEQINKFLAKLGHQISARGLKLSVNIKNLLKKLLSQKKCNFLEILHKSMFCKTNRKYSKQKREEATPTKFN